MDTAKRLCCARHAVIIACHQGYIVEPLSSSVFCDMIKSGVLEEVYATDESSKNARWAL